MNIELQDLQETIQLWRKLQDVWYGSDAEIATHAAFLLGYLTDDPDGKIFMPGNFKLLQDLFQKKIAALNEDSKKLVYDLLMHIRAEKL